MVTPYRDYGNRVFLVSGCGIHTTINIFFQGQPNEKVGSVVGTAGATHAELALQRDALHHAVLAVKNSLPNCADMHVRNSNYDGHESGEDKRAWRETWTVAACGQLFTVQVSFIPNANRTFIAAKATKPVGS